MVTTLKIGRKRYKNVLARLATEMKGFFTLQSNMWIIINDALHKFKRQADIECKLGDDCLLVSLHKELEQVNNENYEIEWIICDISAPMYQREYDEYLNMQRMEESLKKNYERMKSQNKITVKKTALGINNGLLGEGKIQETMERGVDENIEKTICDYLLELDILIIKNPPIKPI
jgi:hypothetical protein